MNDGGSLRYAPSSPYFKAIGYLNSLTPRQQLIFAELQHRIISCSINIYDVAFNFLHPSLVLLRYLRANNFDVVRAIQHIEESVSWRRSFGIDRLCESTPEDVLGTDVRALMNIIPHWHCGYDKFGRPILYKIYSKFDSAKLGDAYSLESLLRYHVWEQEACARLCLLQSLRSGYIVETSVGVFDVGGMHIRQVDSFFISMLKDIASIDQQRYPESLGQIFIINAPPIFSVVWRLVRSFLDPAVTSKIFIFGTSRQEWEAALVEHIGFDNLSSTYGGGAQALSIDLHPYHEIMSTWPRPDALLLTGTTATLQMLPRPHERPRAALYSSSGAALGATSRPYSLASPVYVHSIAIPDVAKAIAANPFSPSLSSPSASSSSSSSSSSLSSVTVSSATSYSHESDTIEGAFEEPLSAENLAIRTAVEDGRRVAAGGGVGQAADRNSSIMIRDSSGPATNAVVAATIFLSKSDTSISDSTSGTRSQQDQIAAHPPKATTAPSYELSSDKSLSMDGGDRLLIPNVGSRFKIGQPSDEIQWNEVGPESAPHPRAMRLLGHADWAAEIDFLKQTFQDSPSPLQNKDIENVQLQSSTASIQNPPLIPESQRSVSGADALNPPPETLLSFVPAIIRKIYFSVLNVFLSTWSYVQTLYLIFKFRRHFGLARALSAWLFQPVQSRSIAWVRSTSMRLIVVSIALSCALLATSVYALAVLSAAASLRLEMWTGVLAVLLCSVTLLINVTGLFGVYLENRYLLIMYMSCLAFVMVLYLLIAVTSSVFLSGSDVIQSYRNKALNGFQAGKNAQVLLDRYNIIMAVSAWAIVVFSALPLYFAGAFALRLRRHDRNSVPHAFLNSVLSAMSTKSATRRRNKSAPVLSLQDKKYGDTKQAIGGSLAAWSRLEDPNSELDRKDGSGTYSNAQTRTLLQTRVNDKNMTLFPPQHFTGAGSSRGGTSSAVPALSADDWVQWIDGVPRPRPHSLAYSLETLLQMMFRLLHVRYQMRVAMIISLVICLIIAFGMIGYGAYAIDYLLLIQFSYTITTAYLLLCCGISLSIFAGFAIWATVADCKAAIWAYKNIAIPLLAILILACAALSFGMFHSCGARLKDDYDSGIIKTSDIAVTQDAVDVQLLIEGLLGFNVVFFQAVCFVCCSELIDVLSRLEECLVKIREVVDFHEALTQKPHSRSQQKSRGDAATRPTRRMHPRSSNVSGYSKSTPRKIFGNDASETRRKVVRSSSTYCNRAATSPWLDAAWVADVCAGAQAPYTAEDDERISKSTPRAVQSRDFSHAAGAPPNPNPVQRNEGWRRGMANRQHPMSQSPDSPVVHKRPILAADTSLLPHDMVELSLAYFRRWEHRKYRDLAVQEKLSIIWGAVIGLIFVYVKGTFVMFSSWMKNDFSPNWILTFWRMLAKSDRRYANAETFFVAKEAFLAVIVGPFAILFAWAVFARSRWRHVLGMLASCTELSAILLVLAVEIRSKFNTLTLADPTVLVLVVVAFDAARLICALGVFISQARCIHAKDCPLPAA